MKIYLVDEVEGERGWGSKVIDQYGFPSKVIAEEFCQNYNKEHNSHSVVPDWYIVQRYVGLIDNDNPIEKTFKKLKNLYVLQYLSDSSKKIYEDWGCQK